MGNGNFLDNMFGKIGSDMCRLSMNGDIAIKTSNGYKTYNVKKNKLVNCNNFVFNIGANMDCFFMIPTNRVATGDIIIANGKPKCVIKVNEDKSIKVLDYEDSRLEDIIPERHVFMGNTYFYGKIVSLFGTDFKGKGTNRIFKYMMMSQMMNGNNGMGNNMSSMFPMMMLMNGNGGDDFFGDIFNIMNDGDADTAETVDEDEDDDEEKED